MASLLVSLEGSLNATLAGQYLPDIYVLQSSPIAAHDFTTIFNKVVESSEKARRNMKLQADKHRNPAPDYVVGQQVWLSMDNLCMLNHTSKKLTEKWIGPYEVTHVTLNAVELKIQKTLPIHPVVNVS